MRISYGGQGKALRLRVLEQVRGSLFWVPTRHTPRTLKPGRRYLAPYSIAGARSAVLCRPKMRNLALISALLLSIGSPAQTVTSAASGRHARRQFDGTWWLSADPGEPSGFVNGVGDCMTWEAHKTGYNETPEQLGDKITKFYQSHPGLKGLSILEAWQRVSRTGKQAPDPKGGETWTNPHWYLNGGWWVQGSEAEQRGFVEGYLWCMRTQVDGPHASYSKSDSFYWGKINAFVTAHPKLDEEAVAKTLARFKDASH